MKINYIKTIWITIISLLVFAPIILFFTIGLPVNKLPRQETNPNTTIRCARINHMGQLYQCYKTAPYKLKGKELYNLLIHHLTVYNYFIGSKQIILSAFIILSLLTIIIITISFTKARKQRL